MLHREKIAACSDIYKTQNSLLVHKTINTEHFKLYVFTENCSEQTICVLLQAEAIKMYVSGFGGLEVACWPLVPKFAGLNPAEAVGFLRAKKSSACLPSEVK